MKGQMLLGILVALGLPILLTNYYSAIPGLYSENVWVLCIFLGAFISSWKSSLKKAIGIGLLAWLALILIYFMMIVSSSYTIDIADWARSTTSPSSGYGSRLIDLLAYPLVSFLLSSVSGGALAIAISRIKQVLSMHTRSKTAETHRTA